MKFWIARDKGGVLYLYNDIPEKLDTYFVQQSFKDTMRLSDNLFPEVNFDNSPKEVELKLINYVE